MKLTNKFDLAPEMVHWLAQDDYDYDSRDHVVSATSLMAPVQSVILKQRFKDQLQSDVSDLIASRYGSALHDSFEKAAIPNTWQEQRFYREHDEFVISGKVDIIRFMDQPIKQVADLKSTSAITYQTGSRKADYTMQLSVYKWILADGWYNTANEQKYFQMKTQDTGTIFYVFTDWSRAKAMQDKTYPQSRMAETEVELWSEPETQAWIESRLDLLREARDLPTESLPECTKDELWQSDTLYAVKKQGSKRAAKVVGSPQEAHAIAASMRASNKKKENFFVETRPGEVKRCNYCDARPFCPQAKRLQQAGLLK